MKKLKIEVTCMVEVEVEDEFPIDAAYAQKIMRWHINEWSDGRYSFATELVRDGVFRSVERGLAETISQRVYEIFNNPKTEAGLAERTRREEDITKMLKPLRFGSFWDDEGPLRIVITEAPGNAHASEKP